MVKENGAGRAGNCGFEIGIFEDDVGRFAAEFKRNFFQVSCGGMDNQLADFGRSCESDFVDVGMCGQRGACSLAVSGNDVDYAFGESSFHDELAETERG